MQMDPIERAGSASLMKPMLLYQVSETVKILPSSLLLRDAVLDSRVQLSAVCNLCPSGPENVKGFWTWLFQQNLSVSKKILNNFYIFECFPAHGSHERVFPVLVDRQSRHGQRRKGKDILV